MTSNLLSQKMPLDFSCRPFHSLFLRACHLTCGCPPLNERREGRGINGFCAFFFKRRNSFGAPPTSFGGFLFHARGGGGGEIWKKASPATMGRGMRRWSHSIQIKGGGGKPGRHSPTYIEARHYFFCRGLSFHPLKRGFGK